MKNLYNLILDFETNLDEENIIKNLNKSYNNIKNDNELIINIKEYKKSNNKEIKNKIISNDNYIIAKHCEAELNLLILEINSSLKRLTNECDLK